MTVWHGDPDAVNPGGSPLPPRPGDICPAGWTEDADRSQMSTEVLIGRTMPSNIPELRYNRPGAIPPAAGFLSIPGPSLQEAEFLYFSRTQAGGGNVSAWLRYLNVNSKIRVAEADDSGHSVSYQVQSAPTFFTSYVLVPVVWIDGTAPIEVGPTAVTLTLGPEHPSLYFDPFGRTHYGRETFTRTDLINTTTSLFETLADRILEVRGSNSVPRVESVTVDARTGRDFPLHNMTVMSAVRPEKPSRYKLRLQVGGRIIFDRMMFATSVRHTIERDEWSTVITFDVAEWAAQL